MKILTITYDASIERTLSALLDELKVQSWTKTFGLFGRGEAGLKLNNVVWPGSNNQIVVGGKDADLRRVAEAIRVLQDEFKLRPGIFMTLQDAEEL